MPIRPSSPAELNNSLTLIDEQSDKKSQNLYDNLYKMASLMETQHESMAKYGTTSTPPVVTGSKPWFASLRGYKPITSQELSNQDMVGGAPTIDKSTADILAADKPVYFKQGKPGIVGIDKLSKRIDVLPYVATEGKDKNQLTDEVHTLLTEPDDTKALAGVTFGSKKTQKSVVVSKDISSALKKAGYPIDEGTIVTQDEYNNLLKAADLGFKSEREGRLAKTTAKDLLIKSVRLELAKIGLKGKQTDAAIDAAMERALKLGEGGDAGFHSSAAKRVNVIRLSDNQPGDILESDFNTDEYVLDTKRK